MFHFYLERSKRRLKNAKTHVNSISLHLPVVQTGLPLHLFMCGTGVIGFLNDL